MAEENLEQTPEQGEQVEKVPEKEPERQVSTEVEEVSGEKVEEKALTEEDIAKRLGDAEKEWQSRKDKEFKQYQETIQGLERQVTEKDLAVLEKREIETWGDTTEVKEFQSERRKFQGDKTTFEQDKQATETLRDELNKQAKGIRADTLAKEFGIDAKELLKAESPEQMELVALKLSHESLKSKLKEKEATPQKVDSGVASVAGVDFDGMSPDEKVQYGLKQKLK